MEHISFDVINEILKFVPTRQLARSALTCKFLNEMCSIHVKPRDRTQKLIQVNYSENFITVFVDDDLATLSDSFFSERAFKGIKLIREEHDPIVSISSKSPMDQFFNILRKKKLSFPLFDCKRILIKTHSKVVPPFGIPNFKYCRLCGLCGNPKQNNSKTKSKTKSNPTIFSKCAKCKLVKCSQCQKAQTCTICKNIFCSSCAKDGDYDECISCDKFFCANCSGTCLKCGTDNYCLICTYGDICPPCKGHYGNRWSDEEEDEDEDDSGHDSD